MKRPMNPPNIPILLKEERNHKDILSFEVGDYADRFNRQYLHWSEVRYRDTGDFEPDIIWARMKLARLDNAETLNLGSFDITFNITNGIQRLLHIFDSKSSVGFVPFDRVDSKKRIIHSISSMMEESIASSQMEGAVTTTKVAKKLLQSNRAPRDRSEQMIINNYRAMQTIHERKDEPLTRELILDIHRIVTQDTLSEEDVGRFRDNDLVVVADPLDGTVYHEPIEKDLIENTIDELCRFVNDEDRFIHPIIKGILIHFAIAYIHPFEDGNGRVARTLFYWYEMKKGYWLMEYLSISKCIKAHKGRYSNAYQLAESDDNDVTYFINFNLDILMESLNMFTEYLERKLIENDDMAEYIKGSRLNLRQKTVMNDMIREGSNISVQYLMNRYAVSNNTARSDIDTLLKAGMIEPAGKDGHRILYGVTENMQSSNR